MSEPSSQIPTPPPRRGVHAGRIRVPFQLGMRGRFILAILVVALLGVGAWWTHTDAAERTRREAAASEAASRSRGPADGPAAACEASRRRLLAGGDPLSLDPEGWVVELWLARDGNPKPLREEPAILEADDERLPSRVGAAAPARVSRIEDAAEGRMVLRFDGGYVRAFMQADGRARFVTLVDELAKAAAVEHAALFARCAHSDTRDVGAYFFGRDAAAAAAALLFVQGLGADPSRTLQAAAQANVGTLSEARDRTRSIERPALEELVRDHGGRALSLTADGTTGAMGIAFPVDGPLRSQQLAQVLGAPRPDR